MSSSIIACDLGTGAFLGHTIQQPHVGQDAGSLAAAAAAAVAAAGLWPDFSPIDASHQVEAAAVPDPVSQRVYQKNLPAFGRATRLLAELACSGPETGA